MNYPTRLIERISDPATEPLSLAEVRTFLRIDGADEDSLLDELIATSRMLAEEVTGKSMITQSWKIAYDDCAPAEVMLPYGPVQSITSVKSIDEDGNETVVAATSYHLNAAKDTLVFESVPSGHRVEIVVVTGFGNAATDVPSSIRQGMLVHVANLYEHRDSMNPPLVAQMLYASHREVRI